MDAVGDDEMVVVIVGDDDDKPVNSHVSTDGPLKLEKVMRSLEKHGLFVNVEQTQDVEMESREVTTFNNIKSEPVILKAEEELEADEYDIHEYNQSADEDLDSDEDYKTKVNVSIDYNEQDLDSDRDFLPEDYISDYNDEADNDDDDADYKIKQNQSSNNVHRTTMLKAHEARSFVEDLREHYPELKENSELLIETLAEIMSHVKVPEPPTNFATLQERTSGWICNTCNAKKESKPAIARHYQEKHGPRYLICYSCGVDFRSNTHLLRHEKNCLAKDAWVVLKARARRIGSKARNRPFMQPHLPPKSDAKSTQKVEGYACSECSAVLGSRSSLEAHVNLHRGLRPFRCQMCPNAYTSKAVLSRHIRTHNNEKLICDLCGRGFKLREALIAHLTSHNPLKKFPCSECGQRFVQRANLKYHFDTVHKKLPPPFGCDVCNKRFARMSVVKAHMKNAHGMLIMTRNMFLKALPKMSDLELRQAAKVVMKSNEEIHKVKIEKRGI